MNTVPWIIRETKSRLEYSVSNNKNWINIIIKPDYWILTFGVQEFGFFKYYNKYPQVYDRRSYDIIDNENIIILFHTIQDYEVLMNAKNIQDLYPLILRLYEHYIIKLTN